MMPIQQGLLITVLGMILVFVVIFILWGLMFLLLQMTSKKKAEEVRGVEDIEIQRPLSPKVESVEKQRRAVAAAVAVELATMDCRAASLTIPGGEKFGQLTPWQSAHRTRLLEQRQRTRMNG